MQLFPEEFLLTFLIGWSIGNMFSQFLFAWKFSWKSFSGYKFLDWKLYLHIYAKPKTLIKSNLGWMCGNRNSYSFLMQIQNDMVTLEDNLAYIYIYIWNHFAVNLKLTQHCKFAILQFFKKWYKTVLYVLLLKWNS